MSLVTMTTVTPSITCVPYRQSSQVQNVVFHHTTASASPVYRKGITLALPMYHGGIIRGCHMGERRLELAAQAANLTAEANEPVVLPKVEEMVLAFQAHDDQRARYQHLLQYAYTLDPLEPDQCVAENQLKGCALQVWVACRLGEDGRVYFQANSTSLLMKGLAAVLVEGLSRATPREVMNVPVEILRRLRLQQSLTPSRTNRFLNLLKFMKKKASEACGESNVDAK